MESPKIAKDRVRLRVNKGGHGIPDETIERRFHESLKNLNHAIEICDEINLYDNTEMFREIIFIKDSKLIWKDKKMPSLAMNVLSE